MRLNSLRLQNFRQHADSLVEFDAGITGIIGANGSGKTTILEGIAWALYGQQAARGTRDSIRWNRAGARAPVRVALDFELGGHRYRVERGLTNAELYLDGAAAPIANTITGVSELLHRRLGMSRAEFFNTYFTGQKELNVMAAMGPSERAHFLSRVLGYEKLKVAQTLARERRKLVVAEATGLRSGMPDAAEVAETVAVAQERLAAAETRAREAAERRTIAEQQRLETLPRWERAQGERERLNALLAELRIAENDEQALRRDEERLGAELAEVKAAGSEYTQLGAEVQPLAALRAEMLVLEKLARDEGRRQVLAESLRTLVDELEKLRQRRTRLENAPALELEADAELVPRRAALEETERSLNERRTEWVRDKQEAETKRQALRTQYAELREQRDKLASLGPDGPCPTCTRPLGANYTTVLDLLSEQLDTVQVDGNYFKHRLEQLSTMPGVLVELDDTRRTLTLEVSALERRLTRCQAAVQELTQLSGDLESKELRHTQLEGELTSLPTGYDASRHLLVRQHIERLAPAETRMAHLASAVERAPGLSEQHVAATARLAAARSRGAELRERSVDVRPAEGEFAIVKSEHEAAMAQARDAELAVVSAIGEANSARAALDGAREAQSRLRDTQRKLDTLYRERLLHDELDRAYSELRTDLNVALRPEVSELASGFLTELTDNRYTELELDDQYNIIVHEDGLPKPVISGGEEDLANLVLRLAISQMIAERAGQAFSLLVLDEVFGSLDELRRHNVVELLRRLQDRFEQVILITHIESVRDGVDRVIEVGFDAESGSSIVRQPESATALPDDATTTTHMAEAGTAG